MPVIHHSVRSNERDQRAVIKIENYARANWIFTFNVNMALKNMLLKYFLLVVAVTIIKSVGIIFAKVRFICEDLLTRIQNEHKQRQR